VFPNLAQLGTDAVNRFFYNLEPCDVGRIGNFSGTQGSIIYVPSDRNAEPEEFAGASELFEKYPGVGAIAVAGIGSSVVGALGLARDVADATNLPVAAVVSGSVGFDLLWQGWNGWMVPPEFNPALSLFETMRNSLASTMFPGFLPCLQAWDSIGCGPEIVTLKSLLRQQGRGSSRLPNLKWIVGHSKGNLVISSALGELILERRLADMSEVAIVLFGAVTALPPNTGNQRQYLGSLDELGAVNSQIAVPYEPVFGAKHWLNRDVPLHLDARAILANIAWSLHRVENRLSGHIGRPLRNAHLRRPVVTIPAQD
jgi:hypothetical protein